jgi:hypothetical protein
MLAFVHSVIGEDTLANYRFDKLFTPWEANELIPTLEVLIRELQVCANKLRSQIAEIIKVDHNIENLQLAQIVERYPQLGAPAARMAELARKIESYGCFLKDIDQGLIDFPWEIQDDDVVFLCWQIGEPRIIAWHSVESGFGQRKPLPGGTKPYLN